MIVKFTPDEVAEVAMLAQGSTDRCQKKRIPSRVFMPQWRVDRITLSCEFALAKCYGLAPDDCAAAHKGVRMDQGVDVFVPDAAHAGGGWKVDMKGRHWKKGHEGEPLDLLLWDADPNGYQQPKDESIYWLAAMQWDEWRAVKLLGWIHRTRAEHVATTRTIRPKNGKPREIYVVSRGDLSDPGDWFRLVPTLAGCDARH